MLMYLQWVGRYRRAVLGVVQGEYLLGICVGVAMASGIQSQYCRKGPKNWSWLHMSVLQP